MLHGPSTTGADLIMAEKNQFNPDHAIPPGEFITEELQTRGWTAEDLAEAMPSDERPIEYRKSIQDKTWPIESIW